MSKQDEHVVDAGCCAMTVDAVDDATAADLAPAFKALGDPVRLRLLALIAQRGGAEVCVCELTPHFDVSGATISHHLKALRTAGLIDCQRRGTWVYYWIIPSRLARLSALLDVDTARVG